MIYKTNTNTYTFICYNCFMMIRCCLAALKRLFINSTQQSYRRECNGTLRKMPQNHYFRTMKGIPCAKKVVKSFNFPGVDFRQNWYGGPKQNIVLEMQKSLVFRTLFRYFVKSFKMKNQMIISRKINSGSNPKIVQMKREYFIIQCTNLRSFLSTLSLRHRFGEL